MLNNGKFMSQGEVFVFVVKIIFGGIAAFLSVLLWSKTKDSAWMNVVAGIIFSYISLVYELLISLGINIPGNVLVFEIPIYTLITTAIPYLFFIAAFIIMLIRNR